LAEFWDILDMIDEGIFTTWRLYKYIDELFEEIKMV